MSHKCIVISEYTSEIDDELYKDIVIFCKVEDIMNEFYKLKNMNIEDLNKMSEDIYNKFINRINLSLIE